MKQRINIVIAFLIVIFSFEPLQACTTAIVSGKYTADGRPLLFKQRDTPQLENKLVAFQDGKYRTDGLNPALAIILQKTNGLQKEKTGNIAISENVSDNMERNGIEPMTSTMPLLRSTN